MRNLYKIVLSIFLLIILFACEDKEIVTINNDINTSLSASESNITLSEDNEDSDVLTLSWTEAELGYDGPKEYIVYFDTAGNDFANATNISARSESQLTLSNEQLNSMLLNDLELEGGASYDIDVKVETMVGTSYVASVSNTETITTTTYAISLDLSTEWGIVGDATENGWDGPDQPFYQTVEDNVYAAYVNLTEGEIKFRKNNSWDLNYGDTGNDNVLEEGGDNIKVTAGTYKITFNVDDLTYSIEEYSWGLVGDATPNGWDGPDTQLTYDPTQDKWTTEIDLNAGELKFRLNNSWDDLNYGDNDADGTLNEGGDNISVSNAGLYNVSMDLNNLTYSLEIIE